MGWLATLRDVVVAVAATLTALATILALAWKPARRWWRRITVRLDQLTSVGGRLGAIESKLIAVESKLGTVEHEVTPNGGGSMKDAQRRTENAVDRIERSVVAVTKDLYDSKAERREQISALAERVDRHIERHDRS